MLVAVAGFLHRCADVGAGSRLRWVLTARNRWLQPLPGSPSAAPSMMARAAPDREDVATWREFAYLTDLFVPLVIVREPGAGPSG